MQLRYAGVDQHARAGMVDDVHVDRHPLALGEQVGNADWRDGGRGGNAHCSPPPISQITFGIRIPPRLWGQTTGMTRRTLDTHRGQPCPRDQRHPPAGEDGAHRMHAVGAHLIALHSAVRARAGYNRHEAPSILMEGTSLARDTAQLTRRHGTLEEAIDAGIFGLSAAGVTRGIRRQARSACEDYFYNRLGL